MDRQCRLCKQVKPLSEFYKNSDSPQGRLSKCRSCTKVTRPPRKPLQKKAYDLQKTYGLSLEQYGALLKEQNGGCAICGRVTDKAGRKLAVDHCHITGRIRGLLCSRCNPALGAFQDNPEILWKAIEYLLRWQ